MKIIASLAIAGGLLLAPTQANADPWPPTYDKPPPVPCREGPVCHPVPVCPPEDQACRAVPVPTTDQPEQGSIPVCRISECPPMYNGPVVLPYVDPVVPPVGVVAVPVVTPPRFTG